MNYSNEILGNLLFWLHEYLCQTSDRIFLGHYVDLFQILYYEVSFFTKTNIST